MRIAGLFGEIAGYLDACLGALVAQGDEVLLYHQASSAAAPYDDSAFTGATDRVRWTSPPNAGDVLRRLRAFRPDAVLMASWHRPYYRRVLRRLRGRTLRILCMDAQWNGSPKQWLGRLTHRVYLDPLFDLAFLPGERQAWFARRLGFDDGDIIRGFYAADQPSFDLGPRTTADLARPPHFLFAGRLVRDKGVDVLAEAYGRYRASVADPWPLVVVGTGPDGADLLARPGVVARGFVQPGDLPGVFREATTLVLPSRFEPWGVVVHEAAASGLSLVCSTAVGAVDAFLHDRWNGRLVAPGDAEHLARALADVSSLDVATRAAWAERSRALSRVLTPQRWAEDLRAEVLARRGWAGAGGRG